MKRSLLVLLCSLSLTLPVLAQSKTGSIDGTIVDSTGQGLFLVQVGVPDLGRGTSTDTSGRFVLEGLPAGKHTLVFSKMGYQGLNRQITVKAGESSEVEVIMSASGIELQTISVTASALAKDPHNNPTRIDVLEGRFKQEQQEASLGATIAQTEGVDNISTGGQSGKPVIRGLSGTRIRVLQDGVPMDYQQYGVRHMPNADPYLAERVEIVQGPSSILYGSDALGGVVNVISPDIPEARGKDPFVEGEVQGGYQTNNEQWLAGGKLRAASGKWGLTGGFVRRSAGNMRTPDVPTYGETGETGDPKFTGELDHTDFDQWNGALGGGYHGDRFLVMARYTHWQNEHNFLLPNGKGLGQGLTNDAFDARARVYLNDTWTLEPSFTWMQNIRRSNPKGMTRDMLPDTGAAHLDILLQTYTSRLEARHKNLLGKLNGVIGVEHYYYDQSTRGTGEALVPSSDIRNWGAFWLEEADLGRLDLTLGVRYDHRGQEAIPRPELTLPDFASGETEGVLEQSYDVLSGSFGANYALTEKLSAAATVGRGFRAPSIFELHAEGVHGGVAAYQKGTPDLDPERSLNTDLTLKWRSRTLEVKATGYRNAITDYIYPRNIGFPEGWIGPPVMEVDQGNALLYGMNAHVHLQLLEHFHIKAGYEMVEGTNRSTDEALPLLPANKLNGELRYILPSRERFPHVHVKAGVRHAFARDAAGRFEPFWQFENLPQFGFGVASTDPYTLVDLGIGADVALWSKPISLDFQVRNLLNTAYRDFLDTYKGYALGQGRNFVAKLTVPF